MTFGISVGDFLPATSLIAEIIRSLREAGGSPSGYQNKLDLQRRLEGSSQALFKIHADDEVPSEYSFEDIEAIIQHHFKTGPRHQEVFRGEYEFCNGKNTKQTISKDNDVLISPGMNLTMAILVARPDEDEIFETGNENDIDEPPQQPLKRQVLLPRLVRQNNTDSSDEIDDFDLTPDFLTYESAETANAPVLSSGIPTSSKLDLSKLRIWKDCSGDTKVNAQFLGSEGGIIYLRKQNGRKIRVPASQISIDDLQHVQAITRIPLDNVAASSSKTLKISDLSKVRSWTDVSERYKVDAEFVGFRHGKIRLLKLNGVEVAVPIAKISRMDRGYVERITGVVID